MAAPHPTEGELAILRVLWARKAPMTVREVHAELSRGKDTAYTTVLKPVVQRSLVKDLVRKAFGGSALGLVQRALDDDVASAEELEQISKLIAQARKARRNG